MNISGLSFLLRFFPPFLAAVFLFGSGLYFYTVVGRAFPDDPPLPPPAAPTANSSTADKRLTVSYDLLEALADAHIVEVPNLEVGYEAAARYYGHIQPLNQLSGLQASLRRLAVTVPLGVKPQSDEEVDHELRRTLYLPTPGRIVWRLRLPSLARLRFALAMLPAADLQHTSTVTVKLYIPGNSTPSLTATFPLEPPKPGPDTGIQALPWWTEEEIDLSSMSGEDADLEIITDSTANGNELSRSLQAHVLVGRPVVLGLPEADQKEHPNLLWINIDTLQEAVTGIGGDSHQATPELDKVASEGVFFSRSFAASNWTRPSNMSFLTGLQPSESGMKVDMIPTLPEERRSYYLSDITALPLHLSRHGYLTRAVVQNNMLEDVWGTGVDVGFGEYRYVRDTLDHSDKITRDATRFMQKNRGESWFLYLGYNAPHWPYRPTRKHLAKVGMAEDHPKDWLMSLYRGEVSLSDAYIGPLMETLHNLHLDDNTLVVINSDHGEQLVHNHSQEIIRSNLWDEGRSTHVMTYPGHETLFNEIVHVPLVMRWTGHLPAGRLVNLPVGTVDIPPTILDLMGLAPLPGIRGRSVVPSINGHLQQQRPILMEGKSIRGVIDWPLKYIRRDGDNGKDWVRWRAKEDHLHRVPEELYDMEKDPHERENLVLDQPDDLLRMRSQLVAMSPDIRYLYFIKVQGLGQDLGCPQRFSIRLSPVENIAHLHLLSGEPEDLVRSQNDSREVLLNAGCDDTDLLVVRTSSAAAQVRVDISKAVNDDPVSEPQDRPGPIRLGQWQLLATHSNFVLNDSDTSVLLDSTYDPRTTSPGISIWRLPVTGGIPGSNGKVTESMQKTFRGWGYVK